MPSITVTWHTSPEKEHCPFCEDELDGHVWVFEDAMPRVLEYNGKPVWEVDHSVAHESAGIKNPCYCTISIVPSVTDIHNRIEEIYNRVMGMFVLPQVPVAGEEP